MRGHGQVREGSFGHREIFTASYHCIIHRQGNAKDNISVTLTVAFVVESMVVYTQVHSNEMMKLRCFPSQTTNQKDLLCLFLFANSFG